MLLCLSVTILASFFAGIIQANFLLDNDSLIFKVGMERSQACQVLTSLSLDKRVSDETKTSTCKDL